MARSSLFLISGPECKVISPRLIEVLSKSKPDYETLSIFLRVLGKIGENEDIVVPILIKALREKSHDGRDTCGDAALALGYMGPKAKKAVPNLIESLTDADRRGSRGLTVLTLEALGRIGPDARDAVPLIRSIASSSSSAIVRAQAEKALKRIGRGRLEI
jgi:hypothetical protein